jgi:DNA-binding HxlR family transcriptional regulator
MSQQPPAPQGFQAGHDHGNCKAELALRMIQGRWKLLILRDLIDGQQRFSDLQLTVHAQVPPRVDYALTSLGDELIPVLESLHAFGERLQSQR